MAKRNASDVPVVHPLVGNFLRILALDVSSTSIGAVYLRDQHVVDQWTLVLKGSDLSHRIWQAGELFQSLIVQLPGADVLAFEAPALRSKGGLYSTIAQARVAGVVLYLWQLNYRGPMLEIQNNTAKVALCGNHKADKTDMTAAAEQQAPHAGPWTEHSADALGIGLAAFVKLQQARQVAEYAS